MACHAGCCRPTSSGCSPWRQLHSAKLTAALGSARARAACALPPAPAVLAAAATLGRPSRLRLPCCGGPSRLQLAVELEDAQAGAHAAQLAHKLGKVLHALRLVRQQVALWIGRGWGAAGACVELQASTALREGPPWSATGPRRGGASAVARVERRSSHTLALCWGSMENQSPCARFRQPVTPGGSPWRNGLARTHPQSRTSGCRRASPPPRAAPAASAAGREQGCCGQAGRRVRAGMGAAQQAAPGLSSEAREERLRHGSAAQRMGALRLQPYNPNRRCGPRLEVELLQRQGQLKGVQRLACSRGSRGRAGRGAWG